MLENIVATRVEASSPEVATRVKETVALPTIAEDIPLPPSLRLAADRLPLVVDLLEAKPYYDTFDVKELSTRIDTYLNKEILRRGLDDSGAAYRTILEEVTKKLHLPSDATVWTKLEKIADYLRINQKLVDAITEREALTTADPLTLTAPQMKKQWELTHG